MLFGNYFLLIFCIFASLLKMPPWDIYEWNRDKKTCTIFGFDSVIQTDDASLQALFGIIFGTTIQWQNRKCQLLIKFKNKLNSYAGSLLPVSFLEMGSWPSCWVKGWMSSRNLGPQLLTCITPDGCNTFSAGALSSHLYVPRPLPANLYSSAWGFYKTTTIILVIGIHIAPWNHEIYLMHRMQLDELTVAGRLGDKYLASSPTVGRTWTHVL